MAPLTLVAQKVPSPLATPTWPYGAARSQNTRAPFGGFRSPRCATPRFTASFQSAIAEAQIAVFPYEFSAAISQYPWYAVDPLRAAYQAIALSARGLLAHNGAIRPLLPVLT